MIGCAPRSPASSRSTGRQPDQSVASTPMAAATKLAPVPRNDLRGRLPRLDRPSGPADTAHWPHLPAQARSRPDPPRGSEAIDEHEVDSRSSRRRSAEDPGRPLGGRSDRRSYAALCVGHPRRPQDPAHDARADPWRPHRTERGRRADRCLRGPAASVAAHVDLGPRQRDVSPRAHRAREWDPDLLRRPALALAATD
jgi:hypothetical protein